MFDLVVLVFALEDLYEEIDLDDINEQRKRLPKLHNHTKSSPQTGEDDDDADYGTSVIF